jgi:hypothetical protein
MRGHHPNEVRRGNLIAMIIHGILLPDELRRGNLITMIIHGSLPDGLRRGNLIAMSFYGFRLPNELRRENLIAMIIHGIHRPEVVARDIPSAMIHGIRLPEVVALDIAIAMIHGPARSLPEIRLRGEIIVIAPGEADRETGAPEPAVLEISTRDRRPKEHHPETLGRSPKDHLPEARIEASIPGPVKTVARHPIGIAGVALVQRCMIPLDSNFMKVITIKIKNKYR